MRVKFIKNASYPQLDPKASREYEAGKEYTLNDDHAQRWLSRGVAVEVKAEPAKVESPKPDAHKGDTKSK